MYDEGEQIIINCPTNGVKAKYIPCNFYFANVQIIEHMEVVKMGYIIALISGALMSVQGVFNTGVTKNTSMWVCNCFVQFTALLAGLVVWFFADRSSFIGITKVSPKYMLLGGIIGTAITYTVVKSMASLGTAKSVMVIVVSQVVVAYVIELLGMFGVEKADFEMKKVIGVLLAIAGIILFKLE